MKRASLAMFVRHSSLALVALALSSGALALEPDVLFARVSPSVWSVRTLDAQERPLQTGSAVVVAPGRLVTSCRVLAKASSVVVRQDNVSYGATLEFPDPVSDLCQLSVARFSAPVVPMAPVGSARPGQRVYAIGNPRGVENILSEGLLSGLRGGDSEEARRLQTTVATAAGMSGGGLFDSEGRLLGILMADVSPGGPAMGSAVPAEFVAELPARAQAVLGARATTPPVPAKPAAVVAAAAAPVAGDAKLTDPLRPGQALEYVRIDNLTGIRAPVVYRLDRIVGDELVFNGGGRVEKLDGRVVSVVSPAGGFFDASTPPGGWVQKELRPGMRWHADYVPVAGRRHDLDFAVIGERSRTVDGVELRVVQISFEGWVYASTSQSRAVTRFSGDLLYSPVLGRVVRFDVKSSIAGMTPLLETLEFVRVLR